MYLSIDNDWNFYGSNKFESDIRNIITQIDQHLPENNVKITFLNGEFTAIEYKPDGNQYKYISLYMHKHIHILCNAQVCNASTLHICMHVHSAFVN